MTVDAPCLVLRTQQLTGAAQKGGTIMSANPARGLAIYTCTVLICIAEPAAAWNPDHRIDPAVPLAVGDEHAPAAGSVSCERMLSAHVVALDQVIFFNRLGAFLPSGMIYALERDVVPISGQALTPGDVTLREDKRPRPLTLRMNVGDCLQVTFTNLLAPQRVDEEQPATRNASMMVDGLSMVGSIASAGSNVGINASSLAAPGQTRTYTWYAPKEGAFLIQSAGAMTGGEGDGGQPDHGLFGVVNVEPRGSKWYRSQVTEADLNLATVTTDATGNRRIDYDAVYPSGHPFEDLPVLAMLDGTEIVHSDLNAIIANIPPGTYPPVTGAAPNRDRNQPFREFTIVYHDENALVQAFPLLSTAFFALSVRDNMAINYGTAGAGAEILSTGPTTSFGSIRQAVGAAKDCNDCKYEEFFLSSWPLGDPAMVVEREMVAPDQPFAAGEAIRALYPDDPSNVHHSYLNDHVRMRVVHGGVKEHHIHHLHAHQWLHQQNSDDSLLLDSQAIGPGSSFSLEILNNGGGNRNKTPGDAIFHCHFYPHFAQGMWELWRVHDVFEDGTRKLPDAELPDGTPIPALVPLPLQAMAPPPSSQMPGYPFYIPGIPGHRAPHPPLDTLDDGGLPRHVVKGGSVIDGQRGLFDRIHQTMDALALPEEGTPLEQAAMAFHAQRTHTSVTPAGTPASFITNGLPPIAGAPFANPCVDDDGNPVNQGNERVIKGAAFQIDAILNKAGWHFPQTRMFAHWADVADFQNGNRAPEPFFMRAHSNDCIEYHFTNLVPGVYTKDDFQVFTPTDILGQHIHLVKFDVTSSDGAANGWNYEDGSFAPDEVIERIEAINEMGGLDVGSSGPRVMLAAEAHPFFGVMGAQTTIQRWWADPVLNAQGQDRTLRTVYTHDHFSPSTHQQTGLYGALLVEPAGSTWRDPETGEMFGTRSDGGPTSWRADILTADPDDSYREFMIEFQDFHLAYTADDEPVNPPGRKEIGLPFLLEPPAMAMPEAISADDPGTFTINYRNEPLALRVRDPSTNTQAAGLAGDLAHAYRSLVTRADPAFNSQPDVYPPLTADVRPGDPFTPLMRAYEGDRVQVRMIVGAHEEGHMFSIHGLRWLHEPDDPRSGYRNSQMMGISEHFEMEIYPLPILFGGSSKADYLYQPGAAVDGQWNGVWGLLREYQGKREDLLTLPSNPDGKTAISDVKSFLTPGKGCPKDAPVREYDVAAVAAQTALTEGAVVYNRGAGLHDPTALLYVFADDLTAGGQLKPGRPIEPLILRASAGDCIRVTLRNRLPAVPPDLDGFNMFPMQVPFFNANQVRPSAKVGLHPQLVSFDVRSANGVNIGINPVRTVNPGYSRTYEWYAGKLEVDDDGALVATPIEFGASNLIPADLLKHSNKGLVAGLIIEPQGATWTFPVPGTRATAEVTYPGGSFREFVMIYQNDLNLRLPDGSAVPLLGGEAEDAEDSGQKAINYRTEPMWTRLGYAPDLSFAAANDLDFTNALSIAGTGPIETPLFTANQGRSVRFRVLAPQGHMRNHVIAIHGHQWRHEPGNSLSEIIGTQEGHGPTGHWDIIPLHGAGGSFGIAGDYLYRDHASFGLDSGLWGVFRVLGGQP